MVQTRGSGAVVRPRECARDGSGKERAHHSNPVASRIQVGSCYMNSVFQCLMHEPITLNWLSNHRAGQCGTECGPWVVCRFLQHYWGPTNPNTIVPYNFGGAGNVQFLNDLMDLSMGLEPFQSMRGDMEYALEYEQVLRNSFWRNRCPEQARLQRNCEVTYSINLISHNACTQCDTVFLEETMEAGVNISSRPPFTTLLQALRDKWNPGPTEVTFRRCPACGPANPLRQRFRNRAALRVLTIRFQLMQPTAGGSTVKTLHALAFDEILDLGRFPEKAALPLQYKLSSVIPGSPSGDPREVVATALSNRLAASRFHQPRQPSSTPSPPPPPTSSPSSVSGRPRRPSARRRRQTTPPRSPPGRNADGNQPGSPSDHEGTNRHVDGHYIAAVRGQGASEFMCFSDADSEVFSRDMFLGNPQRPVSQAIAHDAGYQVVLLSYLMVENRGARELARLV
ncbi:hypothetical protein CC80DRAFT_532056 [Byssothecium circinans]|uniref:Cysteine proteinase n=1 Tax=Byssothecium circinans TaxID=147558 RepID=A0A6A5U9M8_9PLEO|nr:hypothetical protein CC80DRAFT_532056 [Byssothecium circinans]